MYPYTASNLKESSRNAMRDFIGAAGIFGVSHMQMFTQTETSNYMRIMKLPKGPTMTFKLDEYALARDVVKFTQDAKKQSKIFSNTL